MKILILGCGGFSLTVSRFAGGSYPREQLIYTDLDYSAWGDTLRDGPWFEPPHIWNFTAKLLESEVDVLQKLESAFRVAINANPEVSPLVVDDLILPFAELAPRTRAIAFGTESLLNGHTSYFARFRGEFTQPIRFQAADRFVEATIQIKEGDKYAA